MFGFVVSGFEFLVLSFLFSGFEFPFFFVSVFFLFYQ